MVGFSNPFCEAPMVLLLSYKNKNCLNNSSLVIKSKKGKMYRSLPASCATPLKRDWCFNTTSNCKSGSDCLRRSRESFLMSLVGDTPDPLDDSVGVPKGGATTSISIRFSGVHTHFE